MDAILANLPILWIALLAAALLYHLAQMTRPGRALHAAYAAAAAGLGVLLATRTFGWSLVPAPVWMWIFLALFAAVAVVAVRRRLMYGLIGAPWLSALIQLGAVTYMWAPAEYWKPPLAFLLFVYFVVELVGLLRGREEEMDEGIDSHRPPLFAPKRRRGLAEMALAAAAGAMVYVLVIGPRAPVAPSADAATETQAAAEEQASETPAQGASETPTESAAAPAPADSAAGEEQKVAKADPADAEKTPVVPARPTTYTAVAGDTFQTVAKRVFGDKRKWRDIANANPGVKAKLRVGQVIKLPDLPQR